MADGLIFATKSFGRFVRKERISAASLVEAVRRAEQGLIDADLGGGVIKQRIARPGQGKSGGYRTIICFRNGERSVFVFAFAKNAQDNITDETLWAYRDLAARLLNASVEDIANLIGAKQLVEVKGE